ncbi:hypothetical protein [Roseomonas rosulenta]|uniref:hypothetical protein n=1 Tax=Roseomonas rosulenta TaxID=2748667 RepID=UPI0018E02314|nr:hypothetical protein [Roseomonas rosulenta]
MDATLITALRREERTILAELRGSIHYRRLEEIRRLLGLYVEQPAQRQPEEAPIGAFLDAILGDADHGRAAPSARHAEVIALNYERAIA